MEFKPLDLIDRKGIHSLPTSLRVQENALANAFSSIYLLDLGKVKVRSPSRGMLLAPSMVTRIHGNVQCFVCNLTDNAAIKGVKTIKFNSLKMTLEKAASIISKRSRAFLDDLKKQSDRLNISFKESKIKLKERNIVEKIM